MPESGRRVYATHTGRVSKTVHAPLRYVYDWCTDFRSDDAKLARSKAKCRVVQISPRRLVRIRSVRRGGEDPVMAVELIRLRPPNGWHKDTIDEIDLDSIDYRLTALGPRKTRISLVIVERWMVPRFPPRADWIGSANAFWDRLVLAIEERYRSGRPAKG